MAVWHQIFMNQLAKSRVLNRATAEQKKRHFYFHPEEVQDAITHLLPLLSLLRSEVCFVNSKTKLSAPVSHKFNYQWTHLVSLYANQYFPQILLLVRSHGNLRFGKQMNGVGIERICDYMKDIMGIRNIWFPKQPIGGASQVSSIQMFIHLPNSPTSYLSVLPIAHPTACPSLHPSIHPSIYPFIQLSNCPSI